MICQGYKFYFNPYGPVHPWGRRGWWDSGMVGRRGGREGVVGVEGSGEGEEEGWGAH